MITDSKLKFVVNSEAVCWKGQQRLYFPRKLNSFNVDKNLRFLYYQSFIQSVLTFPFIGWYGGTGVKDKKDKGQMVPLMDIFEKQVLKKAKSILDS